MLFKRLEDEIRCLNCLDNNLNNFALKLINKNRILFSHNRFSIIKQTRLSGPSYERIITKG